MDQVTTTKVQIRLEQWKRLIAECQNSGLPVRRWCEQNGFREQTYYYYLKKLRLLELEKMLASLVPVSGEKELIYSVPYGYMTTYVNYSCTSLCATMLPLLKNTEDMKKAVTSLLILRQPITYIHSLMVREISVTIAKEMLRRKPELFAPLYGNTAEEISRRADEILEFISNAALFHDIGKSKIANIINNQYRRITDLEFDYIKLHTLCGPEVMMHMEVFKPYYDIMLGHHTGLSLI